MLMVGLLGCLMGCTTGAAVNPQESAIRRYVDALDIGNYDGAMALRCATSRVDISAKDQFLAEVGRLKTAAGGHLRVSDLHELHPVRLQASNGKLGEHQFQLRLRVPGGTSAVLDMVTTTEDGHQEVCGWSVDESFALRDRLSAVSVFAVSAHVADVKALATGVTSALAVVVVDDAATKGTFGDGVEGWTSAWRTGSFGGGRINVVRYKSSNLAIQHANEVLQRYAPNSSHMFSLSAISSAVGLRYTASAWTGLQPADVGPQIDVAVAGTTTYSCGSWPAAWTRTLTTHPW